MLLRVVPIFLEPYVELMAPLRREVARRFDVDTRLYPPTFDPEVSFDASRGQYNSRILLAALVDESVDGGWILGLTSVDLFIPVLTHVFGEAQLGGQAAIVSVHRLRPEAYGLASNPHHLASRLLKTVVHELGHVQGLVHCVDGACVMHRSNYVEEVDLKSAAFCARCQQLRRRRSTSSR